MPPCGQICGLGKIILEKNKLHPPLTSDYSLTFIIFFHTFSHNQF